MKIVEIKYIVSKGDFVNSLEFTNILEEIKVAVTKIRWPEDADGFYLNPKTKGKGRGQGNGVKPIKSACVAYLKTLNWQDEFKVRNKGVAGTGPLDVVKNTDHGIFALEWETGNISSSHRALNKMALGLLRDELIGGILILPSNQLYPYLTDRVGNYREIIPYLQLWESIPYKQGLLAIIVVEQDGLKDDAPRIEKGTDGRALL